MTGNTLRMDFPFFIFLHLEMRSRVKPSFVVQAPLLYCQALSPCFLLLLPWKLLFLWIVLDSFFQNSSIRQELDRTNLVSILF